MTELGFVNEGDTLGGSLYGANGKDGSTVSLFVDNGEYLIQVGQYPSDPDGDATLVTWNRVCPALFDLLALWVE